MIKRFKEIIKICLFKAAHFLNRPLVNPDTLQISLTSRCNLKCRMCSVNKYTTTSDEEMLLDEIFIIIDKAKEQFGMKKLVLTGGEPLLLGDNIVKICVFAQKKSMETIITTNGFYLKEYCHSLADSGVSHFHVSLDGLENTHNYIRRNSLSFSNAIEGIKILANLKKTQGFKYSIGIAVLILKNNIKELYDLYMYADELGVDIFDMLPYLPDNTDFSNTDYTDLWPGEEDMDKFLESYNKIVKAKTKHVKNNCFTDSRMIARYYKREMKKADWQCMAGFKNIFITMSDPKKQGKFEPCLFMCKEHIPIRDHGYDFKKMWYSDKAYCARNAIKKCNVYCYQPCFSFPPIFRLLKIN